MVVIALGKKGEALRAAKLEKVRTFTQKELIEHDNLVRLEYRQRCIEELHKENARQEAEVNAKIAEANLKIYEANREMEATRHDYQMEVLNLMLCVSSRVLIEQFGFPPIKNMHPNNRTFRFANAIVEVMNSFGEDDETGFIKYCEETSRLYGISYKRGEDEEDIEDA